MSLLKVDGSQLTGAMPAAWAAGVAIGFSDSETPAAVPGEPNQFTLENSPAPTASLQLFVYAVDFGWILLDQGVDYTLDTDTIAIINGSTYTAEYLRAWYRY